MHGGPGSGCTPWQRRLFDPAHYHLILFDQRNCGRSTPHASTDRLDLTTNTTQDLVADIERLRKHLSIDRLLVLGGSWGSTLALAYSESYPERVSDLILFGVTAGLKREFDWLFRGGLCLQFPAQWRRLRSATGATSDRDVVPATHHLLFDADPAIREQTAHEWCLWESAIPEWPPSTTLLPRYRDVSFALAFARIVTHYVLHNAWLEDGILLKNATALYAKRVLLIDGRHDPQTTRTARELNELLPRAEHVIVEDASHAASNTGIAAELVRATNRFSLD